MTSTQESGLKGIRYAPSPTGRFHIGNLRTAWIAQQLALNLHEPLIFRFEDIDKPRVLTGAQSEQLADMRTLGIVADEIKIQSQTHLRHWQLFLAAAESGTIYPCDCSRKDVQSEIASIASAPHVPAPVYSGRCRNRSSSHLASIPKVESLAWRFAMPDASGRQDFIIARTSPKPLSALSELDFTPAYHWACAIDDYDGAYSVLVRAWDLESSAPLQQEIHAWLAAFEKSRRPPAAVFHTSLITQNDGHRLEKRTQGVTLPELTSQNVPPEKIIEVFRQSFDASLAKTHMRPRELGGEKAKTLTLKELGLF